jgi:hypothetical protein
MESLTSTRREQEHGRGKLHTEEQRNIQRERNQADTLEIPAKERRTGLIGRVDDVHKWGVGVLLIRKSFYKIYLINLYNFKYFKYLKSGKCQKEQYRSKMKWASTSGK